MPDTKTGILLPKLLADFSRLQEIYDLRVEAWQHSGHGEYINRTFFPGGWKDHLDERSIHWVIEDNGRIVASARLCVLDDLRDMEEGFADFIEQPEEPFAFYSRLVVHEQYRGRGFARMLDQVRMNYILQHNIRTTLAWAALPQRKKALEKMHFVWKGEVPHRYGANPRIDWLSVYMLRL